MIYVYFLAFIVAFAVLFKSASLFVEGASGIAQVLNVPKMVIGIVLVGLATTAPEFGVSFIAAILGQPEIALGNAIGSVICDDGLALALAALLAPAAITVNCRLLKSIGVFLIAVDILAYALARNGTIGRLEGLVLVLILCVYYVFVLRSQRRNMRTRKAKESLSNTEEVSPQREKEALKRLAIRFLSGLLGVAATSFLIVWAARNIALHFSVSEIIIGSTIVAIGTSLPEISTCVTAALKGEGEIAVGNIIGADILNILWIIGMASLANPITVDLDIINFSFPFMILIVVVMLVSMRIGCQLGKVKGLILMVLYALYVFLVLSIFV
jgi:cation:H+ antiporter